MYGVAQVDCYIGTTLDYDRTFSAFYRFPLTVVVVGGTILGIYPLFIEVHIIVFVHGESDGQVFGMAHRGKWIARQVIAIDGQFRRLDMGFIPHRRLGKPNMSSSPVPFRISLELT